MTALRTDTPTPGNGRFSGARAGTAGVGQAFKRALVSQCHPTMLFAVLLLVVWVFVALGRRNRKLAFLRSLEG